MAVKFSPNSALGQALYHWWASLEHDKGSRAELRRCTDPVSVILTSAYQRQFWAWKALFEGEKGYEDRLAQIMGLLSHVKSAKEIRSLASQMAQKNGDTPTVSELRFRRLLQRQREDLYAPMIRIIRLLDGTVNISDLSESLYYWGDRVRREWAYDYFGQGKAKQPTS